MKYKITTLIFIILLSVNLIGCSTNIDSLGFNVDNEEVEVDYLIVESGQVVLPLTPFSSLNPITTSNESYFHFSKLIYEGLFEFDNNLEPIPQLASTYTIKNEGKTISIKLNEDIYWHDGEKFTAKDVFFTINVLNNLGSDNAYNNMISTTLESMNKSSLSNIINSNIIDEYNIDINFVNGFSNNIDVLTFPIIPSHAFGNGGGNKDYIKALETENYTPMGTGPYQFIDYDKYKSITLKANENYRGGKPSIADITGKVLKDEELFLTAYEAGQLDITPVTGVDWDKYKQNSRIKTLEYISSNYEFIGFNFSNEIISGEKGLAIRKAINYGIDRQEIIQKIYLGHATQIDVPINPDSWLISEEANSYGYNIEKGKQLLKSEGFHDIDGDGILEDEVGNKLMFKLITNPSNPFRFRTAEMIREDLKELGIILTLDFDTSYKDDITIEEATSEWDQVNYRLDSGDYDLALLGWQMSVIPDLTSLFHSSQLDSNNFINYNNDSMDSLLTIAKDSYLKEDKIIAYRELQKMIVDDLPYVSLFYTNKGLLIDSKIMGDLNPTFFNIYNGLEKCFIAVESE